MKTTKKRKIWIGALIVVLLIGAIFAVRAITGSRLSPLDTDGALVSLTQNGDTIVFYPDGTYVIQGDVEIENVVFSYETGGTYTVKDGKMILNESAPQVSVKSKFGSFNLPGDIRAEIVDGALNIHLEASNEVDTYVLADFELGKDEAKKLDLKGITAESWADDGTKKHKDEDAEREKAELDASGALLTVESAGNKIAFFPDGTFQLLAYFTQSDGGLNVDFEYTLKDEYTVKDGKLTLPANTSGALNSDFIASYGYTDVATPTHCSAEIVNGLLELRFVIEADGGEREVAVFKLGEADAKKLGVTGAHGETVVEEEKKAAPAPANTNNAPSQPSVSKDAKPISFSNGGYTITFYSNGQYTQTGSVYTGGASVSVRVTDTYSVDTNGTLALRTGNQVSCYASMNGYQVSFGTPNNTSCSANNGGYTISFQVPANGQTYHVGSVTLTADDVKRIQENYGLQGETPEVTPSPAPTPVPTTKPAPTPTPAPDQPGGQTPITLHSDAGIDLTFYPDKKQFDITGKTVMSGTELAAYSLETPGTYSVNGNALSLSPVKLKVTALHDMAKAMEGTFDISITVEQVANGAWTITLPIGQPPVTYTLTAQQAEQLGLMTEQGQSESPAPTSAPTPTPVPTPDPLDTDNAPTQPSVPTDAKPISFSDDGYTITFYSNGQYTQSGSVYAGDASVFVDVTDTYSVDKSGALSLDTGNEVSCYASMNGFEVSFGAPNDTSCSAKNGGYTISFQVPANGQTYHVGSVTLSADDVKRIQENYGLQGETPEVTPSPTPTPAPTPDPLDSEDTQPTPTPTPEPEQPGGQTPIALHSDAGVDLTFYPDKKQFDITGKTVMSGMELAAYSLEAPGTYSVSGNALSLSPVKLKVTALHDMAKAMEGTFDISITVEQGADGSWIITLPIGQPPVTYTLTAQEAEKLGLQAEQGQSESPAPTSAPTPTPVPTPDPLDSEDTQPTPTPTPTPTPSPTPTPTPSPTPTPTPTPVPSDGYIPDETKTVITFMKDYDAFTISGAGKFVINGMEADLRFQAADTYTVTQDGAAAAANTKDALEYTITLFGSEQTAKATPETSIVKNGDVYLVTLKTTVNGQTLQLASGTVPAEDVWEEEPAEQAIQYASSGATISFDRASGKFTASGSGTLSAMGMQLPLTFNITDGYRAAENGTVTAFNTSGALKYTVMGAGGATDPIVTFVKAGNGYRVKIQANIQGSVITLLDQTVEAGAVVEAQSSAPNASPSQESPAAIPEEPDTAAEPLSAENDLPEEDEGDTEI